MSPPLLDELRELAESCEDFVADIEFVSPAAGGELLEGLLGQQLAELEVFAQTGAGCLLAAWGERIAWLDSEGSPLCVVAGSARDFVALLLLDTGAIYDLAAAWENHRAGHAAAPNAASRLGDVKGMLRAAAELNPDHGALLAWAKERGIEPPADPVALVGQASARAPTLRDLLAQAGVEL